ncbi:MAG: hypothetical protein U9Q73_03360, partial [Nanoarchaeota archaeon]|nr:hypothetical protein [Nanoarchaeota archaeon]
KKYTLEQQREKKLGRKLFKLENKYGESMVFIIEKYLKEDNLIPREIAERLNVSLSTLYRQMDKFGIRRLEKRGTAEWCRRVIKSRRIGIKDG